MYLTQTELELHARLSGGVRDANTTRTVPVAASRSRAAYWPILMEEPLVRMAHDLRIFSLVRVVVLPHSIPSKSGNCISGHRGNNGISWRTRRFREANLDRTTVQLSFHGTESN